MSVGLDAIREQLPAYAKDTKLNLGTVVANSTLPENLVWGTALACAVAARNATVLREIAADATTHLKSTRRRGRHSRGTCTR